MNTSNDAKAYKLRGSDQLSLFSEQQMNDLVPVEKRRTVKRLFCLVERPDGTTYEQELTRVRGEKPWQTCMRYKHETLGKGYWICSFELR